MTLETTAEGALGGSSMAAGRPDWEGARELTAEATTEGTFDASAEGTVEGNWTDASVVVGKRAMPGGRIPAEVVREGARELNEE